MDGRGDAAIELDERPHGAQRVSIGGLTLLPLQRLRTGEIAGCHVMHHLGLRVAVERPRTQGATGERALLRHLDRMPGFVQQSHLAGILIQQTTVDVVVEDPVVPVGKSVDRGFVRRQRLARGRWRGCIREQIMHFGVHQLEEAIPRRKRRVGSQQALVEARFATERLCSLQGRNARRGGGDERG